MVFAWIAECSIGAAADLSCVEIALWNAAASSLAPERRMSRLLSHGYFPSELPPPFHTRDFSRFVSTALPRKQPFHYKQGKTPNYESRPALYNLARAGKLRRPLAIPNPINFCQLALVVQGLWPRLKRHYGRVDQSLSAPTEGRLTRDRAYVWSKGFVALTHVRAATRASMRYAVITDISAFYPSLYTHSIAWALHTKAKAQANTGYDALYGNKIDRLIQNGQSRQTKGVPVGPDTSYLATEIVLSTIDRIIVKQLRPHYFRYVDDYEFSVRTFNAAESTLSTFQEILSLYELSVNDTKTRIIELPATLDSAWTKRCRPWEDGRQAALFLDGLSVHRSALRSWISCTLGAEPDRRVVGITEALGGQS